MPVPLLLFCLPLLFAILIIFAKEQKTYKIIARCATCAIVAATIFCVSIYFNYIYSLDLSAYPISRYIMLGVMLLVLSCIIFVGIKSRSWLVPIIAFMQIGLVAWLEFFSGHGAVVHGGVYVDKLTLIMIITIGLIGSLICLHSTGYMKELHQRDPEKEDRRSKFFSVLFLSLSTAFGFVLFNDLTFMLLFLQIISLCSFLLISYTKSPSDIKNSVNAITTNAFGDLSFAVGVVMLARFGNIRDLNSLISADPASLPVRLAVLLIVCAGLVKSAQLPFSKWLLDTTDVPTSASVMLHSITAANAGVYLIIRLAPMLGQNAAGFAVTFVGGLTFLVAAALAGSQSDARKVLTYSTISVMGLIVVCAGTNDPATQWSAIMLLILHTVAKPLLFLAFGSAKHIPGSRDVSRMMGMHGMSLRLAMFLIIGMAAMLVAPFVMLVSRWTVMQAFMDTGNILIVLAIAFGSALTLFFWTKWIGKLISHTHLYDKDDKYPERLGEKACLFVLAAIAVVVCMLHPLVSDFIVAPFIRESIAPFYKPPTSLEEISVIALMLAMLLVIPILLIPYFKKYRTRRSPIYLAGVNAGDDLRYKGSMGKVWKYELRNRYIITFMNERKLLLISRIVCAAIIAVGFFFILGETII